MFLALSLSGDHALHTDALQNGIHLIGTWNSEKSLDLRYIPNWTEGWISRIVEDIFVIVGQGMITGQPPSSWGKN